ncbi:hypothetical protein Pmani_016103 [Petrolisthes manimaculis]|uniref:Uncharacterized protein n=1 Tax=Petrolisthes manimaculis TaxID=1843537 RepID=A0AAE1PPS9_9EUCA|nr:hypothetical protein Pmani_016103 [Petrolisthes manimaculis]
MTGETRRLDPYLRFGVDYTAGDALWTRHSEPLLTPTPLPPTLPHPNTPATHPHHPISYPPFPIFYPHFPIFYPHFPIFYPHFLIPYPHLLSSHLTITVMYHPRLPLTHQKTKTSSPSTLTYILTSPTSLPHLPHSDTHLLVFHPHLAPHLSYLPLNNPHLPTSLPPSRPHLPPLAILGHTVFSPGRVYAFASAYSVYN